MVSTLCETHQRLNVLSFSLANSMYVSWSDSYNTDNLPQELMYKHLRWWSLTKLTTLLKAKGREHILRFTSQNALQHWGPNIFRIKVVAILTKWVKHFSAFSSMKGGNKRMVFESILIHSIQIRVGRRCIMHSPNFRNWTTVGMIYPIPGRYQTNQSGTEVCLVAHGSSKEGKRSTANKRKIWINYGKINCSLSLIPTLLPFTSNILQFLSLFPLPLVSIPSLSSPFPPPSHSSNQGNHHARS